jgi:hypothetical protein
MLNLTAAGDVFLRGIRFLIHDRSTLFTEQLPEKVKSAGIDPLRLPARSPNLNAFAERFVSDLLPLSKSGSEKTPLFVSVVGPTGFEPVTKRL